MATPTSYQRVTTATDYDTSVAKPYLALSTDDSFGTNSIDFSATDKMSVCAGVTKLSDAAVGIITELSATTANNATFNILSPSSIGANNVRFTSRGTTTSSGFEECSA